MATTADQQTAAPSRPRGLLGRLSWGLGDQAITSMVSFVVGIFVAHELGAVEFGGFSLAWVTYGVIINVSRGMASDPLTVRYSGVASDLWRAAVARATGTALLVGLVAAACCAVAGLVLGHIAGHALVALAVVLPGLVLQDCWRFAFFAAGQGGRAFMSDVTWAVALGPLLWFASTRPSMTAFVFAWGGAAALAALVSGLQARVLPRVLTVRNWLSEHRELSYRYLLENVSLSGAHQVRMYVLGAAAGIAAVGTVRGAELLMGPFFMLLTGLGLFAVPEAARVLRQASHRLPAFCLALGGAQALAAAVWGALLLVALPHEWGHKVLGDVWSTSEALILPITLAVIFVSFSTGASAGLRALGQARYSLRAQLVQSTVYLVATVLGGITGGALGSAWGGALATFTGAFVWWWSLRAAHAAHNISAVQEEVEK